MSVSKLSQITSGGAVNPATDAIVTVRNGNTDVLTAPGVPYTGATTDVNLGLHDLTAVAIIANDQAGTLTTLESAAGLSVDNGSITVGENTGTKAWIYVPDGSASFAAGNFTVDSIGNVGLASNLTFAGGSIYDCAAIDVYNGILDSTGITNPATGNRIYDSGDQAYANVFNLPSGAQFQVYAGAPNINTAGTNLYIDGGTGNLSAGSIGSTNGVIYIDNAMYMSGNTIAGIGDMYDSGSKFLNSNGQMFDQDGSTVVGEWRNGDGSFITGGGYTKFNNDGSSTIGEVTLTGNGSLSSPIYAIPGSYIGVAGLGDIYGNLSVNNQTRQLIDTDGSTVSASWGQGDGSVTFSNGNVSIGNTSANNAYISTGGAIWTNNYYVDSSANPLIYPDGRELIDTNGSTIVASWGQGDGSLLVQGGAISLGNATGAYAGIDNAGNLYAAKLSTDSGTTNWQLGTHTTGVAVQAGKVALTINGTTYQLLTA